MSTQLFDPLPSQRKGSCQGLWLLGLPLSFSSRLLRRGKGLNFPDEGGEGRCLRQPLRSQRRRRRAAVAPRRSRASKERKGQAQRLPAPFDFLSAVMGK